MNTRLLPGVARFALSAGLGCASLACLVMPNPAMAQGDQAGAIEEIVVTGIRSSLDAAADIKRDSDSVVDAITAQDIGLFSDNNIGEALSRVPGVLLEREAGEGYRISIRGLGPRFVRTTINGRTALSAAGGETGGGDDARGFTYNILPSEVISKAQVSKTTQAQEIEGGIGGVVDLETTRPLQFRPKGDDLYIAGTLRGTYNDLSEKERVRGTLFLNNKFSENFGVFLAATYDDADRIDNLAESQRLITDSEFIAADAVVNGAVLGERQRVALSHFSGVRYQEQPISRDRKTVVAGIQWQNENWDVNFDWIAGWEDETRHDKRFWYNWGNVYDRFSESMGVVNYYEGDAQPDIAVPTAGTLYAYEFAIPSDDRNYARRSQDLASGLYRRIPRSSDVNVGGINVEWNNGDNWTIEADIGYADQDTFREVERLRTKLNTDFGVGTGIPRFENGMAGTYDILNGYPVPILYDCIPTCADGTVVDPVDLSHQYIEQLQSTVTWEDADDTSARLDFTYDLEDRDNGDLYSIFDAFKFGVAWNEMQFTREQVRKTSSDTAGYDINTISSVIATDILPDVNRPGFAHSFAVANIGDPVFSSYWADDDYYSDTSEYGIVQNGEFDVTERNLAFYVQGNFSGGDTWPYRGNVGVRYVETDQDNVGWVGDGGAGDFRVRTSRNYDHVLPSLNLAFDLTDEWVLRFAANKALTRPDPKDMSGRIETEDIDDPSDDRAEGGNPNLKPYTTVNYDMSLEWYPERGGSYGLGVFYKDLDSYIATGSAPETLIIDGEPREFDVRRPVNTDGGTIKGVEFQFHIPFDSFTDGFMSYFGVNGSYTYVDAEMDAVVPERGTPISLRGTSEKSGNLVLYFERERFGARVAANYRSDYLYQEASDADRFDEFTKGRTIIDMNLDYIIGKNMKVRFSANDLTDEHRSRYWGTPNQWYSDERDNGQEYVLEFRYASD